MLPLLLAACFADAAETVFETTSVYHHIRVVDEEGLRTLYFDDATETRMSLNDPNQGHCEYTEYFHMPWLWNNQLHRVLVIGLGGGSTQRAYERLYPDVVLDTVEIDPMVAEVARQHFAFKESPTQRVHISDGRLLLRRSQTRYDAILADAYVQSRYGSSIPYHLVTQEFFKLAADHLTTNGVLAYNVIGTMQGWRADLLGSMTKTMRTVFPKVYFFPATGSQNVIMLGTKSAETVSLEELQRRAAALIRSRKLPKDNFFGRVSSFRAEPPANSDRCPLLTDDYAPVDGLSRMGNQD